MEDIGEFATAEYRFLFKRGLDRLSSEYNDLFVERMGKGQQPSSDPNVQFFLESLKDRWKKFDEAKKVYDHLQKQGVFGFRGPFLHDTLEQAKNDDGEVLFYRSQGTVTAAGSRSVIDMSNSNGPASRQVDHGPRDDGPAKRPRR